MNTEQKMTEDEVVLNLCEQLKSEGWKIVSRCLGMQRGNDIVATKGNETLIVEAKGSRANNNAPNKKREHFDSGQIKTHFGKAIVKILEEKTKNPSYKFAIAHPDDEYIKSVIGKLIPFLKQLGIEHYWLIKEV